MREMAVSVPLMAMQAIAARQHNGSLGPENRLREMTVMARQQKGGNPELQSESPVPVSLGDNNKNGAFAAFIYFRL